jgi:archaeal type IV pilus assembly protein PilA
MIPKKSVSIYRKELNRTDALSPVVGEMLMIVLAILLVSLFSVSLAGLLPAGRDYTIDISHNECINTEGTTGTISLWHKGGDWVEVSGLEVLIIPNGEKNTIPFNDSQFRICPYDDNTCGSQSRTFNLGDHISLSVPAGTLHKTGAIIQKGDIIRLVSSRNVIFSGTADPDTC